MQCCLLFSGIFFTPRLTDRNADVPVYRISSSRNRNQVALVRRLFRAYHARGNARDACNRKAESDSSTRRQVRATACVFSRHRRYETRRWIIVRYPSAILSFFRSFPPFLFLSLSDRMSASIGFTDGPLVASPCSTEQNQVYCNSWRTLSFHYIREVKGSHFRNCRFWHIFATIEKSRSVTSYMERGKFNWRCNCSKSNIYCNKFDNPL